LNWNYFLKTGQKVFRLKPMLKQYNIADWRLPFIDYLPSKFKVHYSGNNIKIKHSRRRNNFKHYISVNAQANNIPIFQYIIIINIQ